MKPISNFTFILLSFLIFPFSKTWSQPESAFFVFHCDPNESVDFDLLTNLVSTANDQYNVPITLQFSAPWVDAILADPAKLDLVRQWQTWGNEIAGHHHNALHALWDGYSNDPAFFSNPLFIDTMEVFYQRLEEVCGDSLFLSLGAGLADEPGIDWHPGTIYRTDGGRPTENAFSHLVQYADDYAEVCEIRHSFIDNLDTVNAVKAKFFATSEPYVGVVTHPHNIQSNQAFYIAWLEFISSQLPQSCKTVRQIIRESDCTLQPPLVTAASEVLDNNYEFRIFPNPSSGQLIIEWEGKANGIRIADVLGRVVFSNQTTSQSPQNLTLDTGGWQSGVYFVILEKESGRQTQVVVVE